MCGHGGYQMGTEAPLRKVKAVGFVVFVKLWATSRYIIEYTNYWNTSDEIHTLACLGTLQGEVHPVINTIWQRVRATTVD